MIDSMHLLRERRFLPLFLTQMLNAFNDNLYKNAAILFIVYQVYNSEEAETQITALASALFIVPFIALGAYAGQIADLRDKAAIIRWVKLSEIGIMAVGAVALYLAWIGIAVGIAIPLLMVGVFAMGVHSTYFGPVKYAILPQHLHANEVLGGTGLVEAGTYIAVLGGTVLAGFIPVEWAAVGVFVTALVGYYSGRQVPPAPPIVPSQRLTRNPLRVTYDVLKDTLGHPEIFYAVIAISFFWTIAAVLIIQFPPIVKNVLTAEKEVASILLAVFSIGIAIGSVWINRLLKGVVTSRYSPISVVVMAGFILIFRYLCGAFPALPEGEFYSLGEFLMRPMAIAFALCLMCIAITGGMFVVPLYAFLTIKSDPSMTARTIAANNIVNSLFMATGSLIAGLLAGVGVSLTDQLLLDVGLCVVTAVLAVVLLRTERREAAAAVAKL